MKSAKVIRDFLVVFDEPGGVHYTTFLRLGEVVAVLDDERYEPRKSSDKEQRDWLLYDTRIKDS